MNEKIKRVLKNNFSKETLEKMDLIIGMVIVTKEQIKKIIKREPKIKKEIIDGKLVTVIDVKYKSVA